MEYEWLMPTRRVRLPKDVSRGLEQLRRRGGYDRSQLGKALGVHPRTIYRWETGRCAPRPAQWSRLLAVHRAHAPEATRALAELAGKRMPPAPQPVIDAAAATAVVAAAADALDVAPKHVRAVLEAVVAAVDAAQLPLEAVLRAAGRPASTTFAR